MRRAILLALLLAGCVAEPGEAPVEKTAKPAMAAAPRPRIVIPERLRSCPTPPTVPPAPRTVEQIGAYARALEASRAECAARLRQVIEKIDAAKRSGP